MADQLIQYRIRTILVDLPGHGGRMDEPLTIESAIETIHYATTTLMQQATEKDDKAGLLLLLGVGLGGYAAMEYLGRSTPRRFDGAIILNAGSGVGKGEASFWAKTALSLATSASQTVGAKVFAQATLREIKKTPTLIKDEVHENLIDTGLYFHSATAQLNALKAVATKAALSRFFGPVLFMDGSKDFHDMVDVFTTISVDNELRTFRRGGDGDSNDDDTVEGGLIILSRSIQYPLGTTFFLHDSRFADESFADIAVFVQQLFDRADLLAKSPSLVLDTDELKAILAKQQEAADQQQKAVAAASESPNNTKPQGSFFEKAKGTWNRFTAKKNSPAEEKTPVAATDTTSSNRNSDSTVPAATAEAPQEGNTRASTVSVAVPYVESRQQQDEVVVRKEPQHNSRTPVAPPREEVVEETTEADVTPVAEPEAVVEAPVVEAAPEAFEPAKVEEEVAGEEAAAVEAPVEEEVATSSKKNKKKKGGK
eukprot:GILJ01020635.1.p1 GENE.GILJ01020635.1~~GILJ01020635.1.p1  ORF type:complete len:497 (+),score=118.75 GILJ01020635.1:46-1491(+)